MTGEASWTFVDMPVVVHVRVVDDFFVQFIDWVDVPVLCSDVSIGLCAILGEISVLVGLRSRGVWCSQC